MTAIDAGRRDAATGPIARWRTGLRIAARDLRGGLRGFGVFIACMALGVMTIAGVGSISRSLSEGIAQQGRAILGGDISFNLVQREASPDERRFLAAAGDLSVAAAMRALARTAEGRSTLVELKAVDAAYPLYGAVETDPPAPLHTLLARDGDAFGAVVDPLLLARLGLERGARVTIGSATLVLNAAMVREPDRLAGGVGFGPRVLVSEAALRATGLLQPGSLVRWIYRVRLAGDPIAASDALEDLANRRFPNAGWDVRASGNASPQLERNIDRFTQFLTLVGLTALLVGGVGVANSTRHYLDRKRDTIATLKSLGATGGQVVALYFAQILLLAAVGGALGLLLGAALPFAIAGALGALLPLPLVPTLHADVLALAMLYGLLTAVAFAAWPLGRAHDVPVSALFRDAVVPDQRRPRRRYVAAALIAAIALAALAIGASYDRRIATAFVGSALAVLLLLRLVATAVMAIARRAPRPRSAVLRLAVANIHRPAALTPTVVISLGLGMALLVTILQIDGNLRQQFTAALPERAPSFFFLDIPTAEAARFDALVKGEAPGATFERVPMLRGRIVAANGVRAEDLKIRPDASWALHGDRGITYAGTVPPGSRVVEGTWWGEDYRGPPLLSLEKRIAEGLGLNLGDTLTVNVLGRNITAAIANIRTVDWQSLGINFVLVFSPGAFAGAPHTDIATVTFPAGGTPAQEAALLDTVARAWPGITPVPVKDALDQVARVVGNLSRAIEAASGITLVSAVLVLAGALAAGHRHRVYDAVVLKTLGATRRQLVTAYLMEYLLIGAAAVLFGVLAGSIAGWRIVAGLMNLPFVWQAGPALAAALGALAVTVACGLLGTVAALGRKPAGVLRSL
ncbi:FtsX-like permease family protein [Rhodoplanes sp. TEM]|uniref:FtsX-like permease family protein n=1 Tax=Rhodoplanes tepidamans TaxID=200616 RepID=A0ABT5J2X9_RHOTP|nr:MULTISPECIES: FtsX-like permease family protein [Rhodoplanes]MDC7784060.1 FtsX-like permease family protein [Rhodoplanes tepidamans]MDC7986832.1 FtsX-like permease family protein [Rhodoplanes sp. TEM]MDQ0356844.1 putative ABC transport system permease protein [Rhodoplanes tepidamans]